MTQELSHFSLFQEVKETPVDPIFGLQKLFLNDPRKIKYNLTVGFFAEVDGGQPKVLPTVLQGEKDRLQKAATKNYLPITGSPDYIRLTGKLIFGDLYGERVFGAQTVGGTSALRIAGDFLVSEITDTIAISKPTWPNHKGIMEAAGLNVIEYPYWNGAFQYEEMLESLRKMPKRTAVLLQPMSHNPTGVDLSFTMWEEVSQIMMEKELVPVFDIAYQGLGVDFNFDVEPIRIFMRHGHEMFVTYSYSKSMAMYNERVGALYIVMKNVVHKERITNRIARVIRTQYSNPPAHGAYVASFILDNRECRTDWMEEVNAMRDRVILMRQELSSKLNSLTKTNRFSYISEGHGFFALLGLSKEKIEQLRGDFGVYVGGDSRVNIAALNASNIDFIAEAIAKVL